jgi:DNA-binding transcriptional ArsR family regulator
LLQNASNSNAALDLAFHALGDKTRRTIVQTLVVRPQSVTSLAGALGITLTAVGQHLQVLQDSGLVVTKKTGRVRECQLNPDGFKAVEDWARQQRMLWEERLDRLGEVLDED